MSIHNNYPQRYNSSWFCCAEQQRWASPYLQLSCNSIFFCCRLIFLQRELIAYFFSQKQNLFTFLRWGGNIVAFGVQKILRQTISFGSLLTKNGDKGSPLQTGAAHYYVHYLQKERRYVPLLRISERHEVLS